MKKNLLYIALAFSMLINVAVLCVLLKGNISSTTKEEESPKEVSPFADYNKRQTAAENAVRRYVCENLYYPNSYDPVSTKVDSVFYNPQIRNYAHHIMNWWSKSTSYPSPSFSCPVDNRQLGNNVFSLSAVLKS